MHRIFKKEQILTLPNLLSAIRIALIPLIIWLYCVKARYYIAAAVISLSGLTDIIDGQIARRWGKVSDFGKILDPVADKLTQGAILICLCCRYRLMLPLTVLFAAKEIIMAAAGVVIIKKKDQVNSAQWFGKVNTVIIYATVMMLILFPAVSERFANALIIVCGGCMFLSLFLYMRFYFKILRGGMTRKKK